MALTSPQPGKQAVLAVDLQRDFLEDSGRLPIARTQVTATTRGALRAGYRVTLVRDAIGAVGIAAFQGTHPRFSFPEGGSSTWRF